MTHQDFMPHWKDEEKCFQDEKIEMKDKNGKKIFEPWPRDSQ